MRHPFLLLGLAVSLAACDRPATETEATPTPKANEPTPQAPPTFNVRFETSRGSFVIEVHRDWSPNGVDRFHQLVSSGFFDNARFFRVLPGFVVQFGIHSDPSVASAWQSLTIPDDPVTQSNRRGTITFATAGANSRTTQLFINFQDNANLDGKGFSPFGMVKEGMNVVDSIYAGYGEQPDQNRIRTEGNAYLEREFPQLDFIRTVRVVPAAGGGGAAADPSARRDTSKS